MKVTWKTVVLIVAILLFGVTSWLTRYEIVSVPAGGSGQCGHRVPPWSLDRRDRLALRSLRTESPDHGTRHGDAMKRLLQSFTTITTHTTGNVSQHHAVIRVYDDAGMISRTPK